MGWIWIETMKQFFKKVNPEKCPLSEEQLWQAQNAANDLFLIL